MKIKEVEIKNFRIYKGINVINLLPLEDKNIIIVSGKNGYGKTTFLMSLVWCLYGKMMQKVDKLYEEEIKNQGNYQTYMSNSINRLAKFNGETLFSVSITFIEVDLPIDIPTKEIKITRSFDTLTKEENLEIYINGVKNEITEEYGKEKFINDFILPREIAKFFFFDAEKIVSLAEVHKVEQKKELSRAYSEVLGIKKYEDLRDNLQDLLNNLKRESATPAERVRLTELKNKIEKNKILIENYKEEILELEEEINLDKYRINEIEEKLVKYGHKITEEEYNNLKKKRDELSEKLKNIREELIKIYRYVPFGIAGNKLAELKDQLDLEKKFKIEKFNIENIEEKTEQLINKLNEIREKDFNNIIPVKVQEFYNNTIRKLIKEYFYEDIEDIPNDFNILHNFSDTQYFEFNKLIEYLKTAFKDKLSEITRSFKDITYELTKIEREIKKAEANLQDDYIKQLTQDQRKLRKTIDDSLKKIGALENEIKSLEDNNISLIKEVNKLSDKIEVSDKNKKKAEKYKELIKQINDFIKNFQQVKKKSLEESLLRNLKELMHMELVNKVEVDITTDYIDIRLYNKRNEEILKDSLSKGQQQIYASSLLKSLVEESEFNFPVFIDSPMQKFDETHSENIIKYFYLNVSEQVVIFPLLNKELTEKEFKLIKERIAKAYIIQNINEDASIFKSVKVDKILKYA